MMLAAVIERRRLRSRNVTSFVMLVYGLVLSGLLHAGSSLPIKGQVTFLYYEDVDAAATFYRDTLGLENTLDDGWVQFFAITPTSWVALVEDGRGYHRVSADKPVMLSIVTSDVAAWYQQLQAKDVTMLKPLNLGAADTLVDAFLIQDPGGYTVEFFQWRQP
jgi:catechol 2,3-dioxygenase-like lactoylglutathione lyase family enzyme